MAGLLTDRCTKCGRTCALDEHNIPRSLLSQFGGLGGAHCPKDGHLHDALPDLTNTAAVRLWNATY